MSLVRNNLENQIKRALSFWNFELADTLFQNFNREQKYSKEYLEFLFETGQFEKIDLNLLKDSDTKWGGGKDYTRIRNLTTKRL